jgi:hypothetical protein
MTLQSYLIEILRELQLAATLRYAMGDDVSDDVLHSIAELGSLVESPVMA